MRVWLLSLFAAVLFSSSLSAAERNVTQNTQPVSTPEVKDLLAQVLGSMTGGLAITDAQLSADVTWNPGLEAKVGTATLRIDNRGSSTLDLSLDGSRRAEILRRGDLGLSGEWIDDTGKSHPIPPYNAWTDTAWFLPALTSPFSISDSTLRFAYLGQEQSAGIAVQHFQVWRELGEADEETLALVRRLSTTDLYLDGATLLPVALCFSQHPDGDSDTDVRFEIRYSDYRTIGGIRIPSHITRYVDRTPNLDIVVKSVAINSGPQN